MGNNWANKTSGGHRILIRVPHEASPWRWRGIVQDEHGTMMCWWTMDGKYNTDGTQSEYDLTLSGSAGDGVSSKAIQAFSEAAGAYIRARNAVAAAHQLELDAQESLRAVLSTIDGGAVIATDPAGNYWLYRIEGEKVEVEQIHFS